MQKLRQSALYLCWRDGLARVLFPLSLSVAAIGTSCAGTSREGKPAVVFQQDNLMDQAAYQMNCPRAGLTVVRISDQYTAGVEGCGKKFIYKHAFGVGWVVNTNEARIGERKMA